MINGLFTALTWLLGLAATIGPLAVILGVIFAPAIAIPLVSSIATRFFACTRCMIAAAAIFACIGSYWIGRLDATAECRAGELEAQLRNARIDADNAKRAKEDEALKVTTIEENADARAKRDADYIKSLESRPGCALDCGDADGLCNDKPRPGRARSSSRAR